jgi:hypothetical protein
MANVFQIKAVKYSIKLLDYARNAHRVSTLLDSDAFQHRKLFTIVTFGMKTKNVKTVNMVSFHMKTNAFFLTTFKRFKQVQKHWFKLLLKRKLNSKLFMEQFKLILKLKLKRSPNLKTSPNHKFSKLKTVKSLTKATKFVPFVKIDSIGQ